MMDISTVRPILADIYLLTRVQRATRHGLRALWLLVGGYLLGWGLHELFGWFPQSSHWWGIGFLLGAPSFIIIFFPRFDLDEFSWKLDRKLGLKEQVSAAAAIAKENSSEEVPKLLLSDAADLLAKARNRVRQRGWYVQRDFEATLIVGILAILVLISTVSRLPAITSAGPITLPALGQDPSAEDVFPSGIPGLTSALTGSENEDFSNLTASELGEIGDVLSELGEDLSDQAAISELGGALQQGDYEDAAEALETLAGQLDQLSEETLQEFANDLRDAAGNLQQPGQQDLAQDLSDAAGAVQNPDGAQSSAELDALAGQLRALGQQLAEAQQQAGDGVQTDSEEGALQEGASSGEGGAGAGAGASERGDAEPAERLNGEGQVLDLGDVGDAPGLLQPGRPPEGQAQGTLGGQLDFGVITDSTIISALFDPFNFSWFWQYVIAAYFSPP